MKIVIVFLCCLAGFSGIGQTQFVTIGRTKLAFKTSSLEKRKPGEPVVVFEAGFGSGGGSFDPLIQLLPGIPCFTYDRNGLGESEIDTNVKTDTDVVRQLHDLLAAAEIPPPYLLVGHSLGGPYIRLFAATYPEEVCGLLFTDPTDFMLTAAEDEAAKKASDSKTGYIEVMKAMFGQIAADSNPDAGVRNEAKRTLANMTSGFFGEYRNLKPLKDIPVTIFISYAKKLEYNEEQMNKDLNLGINILPWWAAYDKIRIGHYLDMIAHNQNSRIILLPGYSHGIHHQDPPLVAAAVHELYVKCAERG